MIVVRFELHSAITGAVTELARMHICNVGGTMQRRNYEIHVLRGRSKAALDQNVIQRQGTVTNWPSEQAHVWNLVAEALRGMGYGRKQA
ncbi:MAG: hypothetical protein JWR10_3404 [Rubritepida sp.]|nr:hypothetical protein [Rubritepida sp.]